jgi:ribosomal protein S27E
MTTTEKVAYLKGLMDGMKLDTETNEGKLFSAIADILADMAEDMEDLSGDLLDLGEDVDAIRDDLSDVEDYLFDDDWDDEDEEEDEDDEDDDEEPLFFEVTCPSCEKTITVDEDVLNLGSIQCPNCGEMMEFEFDEDDGLGEDDELPE